MIRTASHLEVFGEGYLIPIQRLSQIKSLSGNGLQLCILADPPFDTIVCFRKVRLVQDDLLTAHTGIIQKTLAHTSRAVQWFAKTMVIGFAAYGAAYCGMPLTHLLPCENLYEQRLPQTRPC